MDAAKKIQDTLDSLRPFATQISSQSIPVPPPGRSPLNSLPAKTLLCLAAAATVSSAAFGAPHGDSKERSVAVPTIKHGDTGDPTRWHVDAVEVTLDSSLHQLGVDGQDKIRASFGSWIETDANLPAVRFNIDKGASGKAVQDGVNRVIAAPITLPGHEKDLAITISYITPSGTIVEADMIINTTHPFTIDSHTCSKRYDLQSVATHEVGHFFGLGEDTEDHEATMFFKTSPCETKKRTLSDPDWMTVEILYDQSAKNTAEAGVSCSVRSLPKNSSYAWCFLPIVGLIAAFRRTSQTRAKPKKHAESA